MEREQCSMANSELIRNRKGQRSEKNQATKNIRYSFLLHMNCNSTDQLDLLLPVAKTMGQTLWLYHFGTTLWFHFMERLSPLFHSDILGGSHPLSLVLEDSCCPWAVVLIASLNSLYSKMYIINYQYDTSHNERFIKFLLS